MKSDSKRDPARESGLWYLAGLLGLIGGLATWGMGMALIAMSLGSGKGTYPNTGPAELTLIIGILGT